MIIEQFAQQFAQQQSSHNGRKRLKESFSWGLYAMDEKSEPYYDDVLDA